MKSPNGRFIDRFPSQLDWFSFLPFPPFCIRRFPLDQMSDDKLTFYSFIGTP